MTHRGAVIPSPNIWKHPGVYEAEIRGADRAGVIDAAMRSIHDWAGQTVVDVGCGTGFHLGGFAGTAARVVGVEPHPATAARARKRVRALEPALRDRIQVVPGTAQDLPLPAAAADVTHARWAYFFGPGCEPGLRELARVVRRGGTAFVVDNDAARSTFGVWFRRALPRYDPAAVERFWARQGWQRVPLDITLEQPDRVAFEAVARIEFPPQVADAVLADHSGTSVDYAVNLFWHRF
jgi:SAM-dependent methyltransferase